MEVCRWFRKSVVSVHGLTVCLRLLCLRLLQGLPDQQPGHLIRQLECRGDDAVDDGHLAEDTWVKVAHAGIDEIEDRLLGPEAWFDFPVLLRDEQESAVCFQIVDLILLSSLQGVPLMNELGHFPFPLGESVGVLCLPGLEFTDMIVGALQLLAKPVDPNLPAGLGGP